MKHSLKHLKLKCAACERSGRDMNKEHVFPRWLILRTNTHNTGIRWAEHKRLPALKATIPLCTECNRIFGKELEEPVSKLFNEIESHRGISDLDAELLIRWLWKTDGLIWIASNPNDKYTTIYTLKERVLRPIDRIREHLVLAVSLIEDRHPESEDWPMGIDSCPEGDAVFVSGVFSKIAIMVLLDIFIPLIPEAFSYYCLAPRKEITSEAKLFHPKVGFRDDIEAVRTTFLASMPIEKAHDDFWRQVTALHHTKS
jgi:hypothetical protein